MQDSIAWNREFGSTDSSFLSSKKRSISLKLAGKRLVLHKDDEGYCTSGLFSLAEHSHIHWIRGKRSLFLNQKGEEDITRIPRSAYLSAHQNRSEFIPSLETLLQDPPEHIAASRNLQTGL
jgi:hypothetical protein